MKTNNLVLLLHFFHLSPVTYLCIGTAIQRSWMRMNHVTKYLSGAPNVNFRKISVRKAIGDLELSEHTSICCKISCLPASPRTFEHLKHSMIAHF